MILQHDEVAAVDEAQMDAWLRERARERVSMQHRRQRRACFYDSSFHAQGKAPVPYRKPVRAPARGEAP